MNRDKLKNLTLNITDGEHGSIIDSLNSSYYLLSNKNIKNGKINITNDDRKISIDSFNKIRKRTKLSNNDVVVASVGTIGKTAIIKGNNINFDFQRSVAIIKPNQSKITSDYLYYFFNVPYVKKQLQNKANGAVQKCLYINDFENLDIDYHDILTQQKITSILSIFDEKMELNNKINKELEKIAKTLYDYWFVQFDFPNENGKPYKSSGGKMVWSDELKKEIPKEWTVASLYKNSLTSILKPKIEKFEGSKEYLATANINGRKIIRGDLITYENRESRANMQPVINSVWFAKMKSSRKHIFIGKYSDDIIENNIFSTGFLGLKCEDLAFEYIASFISSDIFELTKDIISHGATMQGIGNDDLKIVKLVIPRKEVLMSYKKITEDVYKKIDLIRQENKKLEEVRDWLLPMLMNGQVITD
ncbi:MAG: restriction endonuclease subunit S [Candidatus Pacebacteria bacterium]|nr:restriction endonuclease subunit S [Candidatus Paceibacterota bacterium]